MQNNEAEQKKRKYQLIEILKNHFEKWKQSKKLNAMSKESLKYYHDEFDIKENKETEIPNDENIRQNCLWLMEIYPPESINNLITCLEGLDWKNTFGSSKNDKLSEKIKNIRENNLYSWHNLGYIVPHNKKSLLPSKESILPFGVRHIKLSLLHSISSTTILIFQFIFDDEASSRLEKTINKKFSTYVEKIKNGNQYITPISQKMSSLVQLKKSIYFDCINWIKDNLQGYYTANNLIDKMPICDFITLDKATPFPNKSGLPNSYLHILNMNYPDNVWLPDDLDGLYFRFSISKDQRNPYMQLVGKFSEILKNKNLKHYGGKSKNGLVNYLKYFDNTLAMFALFYLYKTYEWQVSKIRDEISNINISKLKKASLQLNETSKDFAILDRNLPFFTYEIKEYCRNKKLFFQNVYTFHRMKEDKHKRELMNEIRISLKKNSKILLTAHNNLRQSLSTTSNIINSLSNEKLSRNSYKLQVIMCIMMLFMFIFTIFLSVSH
ncbi:MAG: hypothetical protein KAW92_04770 [Candidatus Cloacimonetes bacterium]|nr:hypothetical protein [Candidatus Cloacimonadota bacterium]